MSHFLGWGAGRGQGGVGVGDVWGGEGVSMCLGSHFLVSHFFEQNAFYIMVAKRSFKSLRSFKNLRSLKSSRSFKSLRSLRV